MRIKLALFTTCLWLGVSGSSYSMGLRSFVALPVEKGGAVTRLTLVNQKGADTSTVITSTAYGFSANKTLLLAIPYRLSQRDDDHAADVSILYRHITWREDSFSGTNRLGLLGGAILPTENNPGAAIQTGFVFTHFKNRHEIDVDALFQQGLNDRLDSGRYDISWQYRLRPVEYPDWGFIQELNTVLELNGRWIENSNITHQATVGLQSIHQRLVVEGGVVIDINNDKETQIILSTRYHF